MSLDEMVRSIVVEELERRGLRAAGQEPAPLLLTIPEAARRTSISPERLRAWVASGRLPKRVKNPDCARSVLLVSLDEIRDAAAGKKAEEAPEGPVSLAARRIARGSR